MTAKELASDRRRSRPVTKPRKSKLTIGVVVLIVIIATIGAGYFVIINFSNSSPIVNNEFIVVTKNSENFVLDLLGNDVDNDGDTLFILNLGVPLHGTVNQNSSGIIEYTPSEGYEGIDSFTYTISDERGGEAQGQAIIVVSGNQPSSDNNPIVSIDTSMGEITIELYIDKAPNTCQNFIKLASDGFYENLVFHRVIDDFMIQGGGFDQDGTRKESPYGPIDLEIHPDVRHVDGAIAMARTTDPNSATSQFYICDGAQTGLDDEYAVFGKTINGIEIVRNIASVDTTTKHNMNDWPVNDIIINSITV
jgi:cyclophilin family peptidyl-prolyl cis-trans isomerase